MTSDPDTPPVDTSSPDHVSEQFDTDQVFERYEEDGLSPVDGSAAEQGGRGGPQPGVDDGAADGSETA